MARFVGAVSALTFLAAAGATGAADAQAEQQRPQAAATPGTTVCVDSSRRR